MVDPHTGPAGPASASRTRSRFHRTPGRRPARVDRPGVVQLVRRRTEPGRSRLRLGADVPSPAALPRFPRSRWSRSRPTRSPSPLGPVPVHWYGDLLRGRLRPSPTCLITREARRRGPGGRAGRPRDRLVPARGGEFWAAGCTTSWTSGEPVRRHDPLAIVLPPYTGLGVFGGHLHRHHRPGRPGASPAAELLALGGRRGSRGVRDAGDRPVRQLLQPGTVRSAHHAAVGHRDPVRYRVDQWPCSRYPEATTGFQPLFLYESLSGVRAPSPCSGSPAGGVPDAPG